MNRHHHGKFIMRNQLTGQTMPQLYFHVIPRYTGDVPDPRGGIRHIIPSKAHYWEQNTTPAPE
jgi:diadenosine tetraphosphate (Ap4A) HIT family hydrolase